MPCFGLLNSRIYVISCAGTARDSPPRVFQRRVFRLLGNPEKDSSQPAHCQNIEMNFLQDGFRLLAISAKKRSLVESVDLLHRRLLHLH